MITENLINMQKPLNQYRKLQIRSCFDRQEFCHWINFRLAKTNIYLAVDWWLRLLEGFRWEIWPLATSLRLSLLTKCKCNKNKYSCISKSMLETQLNFVTIQTLSLDFGNKVLEYGVLGNSTSPYPLWLCGVIWLCWSCSMAAGQQVDDLSEGGGWNLFCGACSPLDTRLQESYPFSNLRLPM